MLCGEDCSLHVYMLISLTSSQSHLCHLALHMIIYSASRDS